MRTRGHNRSRFRRDLATLEAGIITSSPAQVVEQADTASLNLAAVRHYGFDSRPGHIIRPRSVGRAGGRP